VGNLSSEDFVLATCQATLFTPDEELSANRLVQKLIPRWTSRFDSEPTILQPAKGLPREVPRVILRNKSGGWICEIASARINIFRKKLLAVDDSIEPDEFFGDASTLFEEYTQVNRPRIGRIAAVINSYTIHENPGLFLAEHFCKERCRDAPLNRPENFELHAHKRFSLGDKFTVNSWVRNKTGSISSSPEKQSIVLVEQDINTLTEEMSSQNFTVEQFKEFFKLASREFGYILKLYYPKKVSQ
jgi:hypothetical protein